MSTSLEQRTDVTVVVQPVNQTQWKAVVILALATLIVASELTLAAIALPQISTAFGVPASATAWVLLAYTLPLVSMAIPAGRWVDGADVRLVFLLSLTVVGFAGLLAATATSFAILLLSRVLQGFASAVYLAVYMPVVSTTVLPEHRGRAISLIATIMMVGSVALTPLGGLVADVFGWPAVFLIKLPLVIATLWMGYQTLTSPYTPLALRRRLPPPHSAMLLETLLVGGAVAALLSAFEVIEQHLLWALLFLSLGMAILVTWSRLSYSKSVVRLLAERRFGMPALSLMLVAAIIGLMSFTLPFFVMEVMHQGPKTISLAMLSFVAAAAVVSPLAGMLADRFGALTIATVGAALTAVGMISFLTLDAEATALSLALRTAAAGAGMAVFNAPNTAAILEASPSGMTGTASGISSVSRMLGSTIGPAVAALAWSLSGGGVAGLHAGAIALAGLVVTGFLGLLWARGS